MIPAAFEYIRAGSTEEALSAIAEHGDEAKILAGGHSLIPLMRFRLARPEVLVDVGQITDLSYINDDGDHLAIGALTRHKDVETSDLVAKQTPLLQAVTSAVGDPQVRHRGTIGGATAHGDPASDIPSALIAHRAILVADGPNGKREIPVDDFFKGFLETDLSPDEMLVEVRVPKAPKAKWSFQKFNRRAQDWAIVGVSALVDKNQSGVGLVNMDSVPFRATEVEEAISSGANAKDAAGLAAQGCSPSSDLNASAKYREHLARVMTERALAEAGL